MKASLKVIAAIIIPGGVVAFLVWFLFFRKPSTAGTGNDGGLAALLGKNAGVAGAPDAGLLQIIKDLLSKLGGGGGGSSGGGSGTGSGASGSLGGLGNALKSLFGAAKGLFTPTPKPGSVTDNANDGGTSGTTLYNNFLTATKDVFAAPNYPNFSPFTDTSNFGGIPSNTFFTPSTEPFSFAADSYQASTGSSYPQTANFFSGANTTDFGGSSAFDFNNFNLYNSLASGNTFAGNSQPTSSFLNFSNIPSADSILNNYENTTNYGYNPANFASSYSYTPVFSGSSYSPSVDYNNGFSGGYFDSGNTNALDNPYYDWSAP